MFHYEKAWQEVMARIARAATSAGRDPGSVRLLAVSKTFAPDAIRAVHALGQRAFGENYVQECAQKIDALADLTDIEWHLIGPLQANKAAVAAGRFAWVQTPRKEGDVMGIDLSLRLKAEEASFGANVLHGREACGLR